MNETILVVETFTTDTVSAVQDVLSRGQSLAYIVAALLFILALAGLSKQKSAMRGNVFGIIGMVVALAIVIVATTIEGFQFRLIRLDSSSWLCSSARLSASGKRAVSR